MTPLSREERDAVIRAHPAAEPGSIEADLDEYESLVAADFATDPSAARAEHVLGGAAMDRLAQLHEKLFGRQ
ncbi:MAG: hypothetical protein HYX27_10075 [Acidobacteria bacterium]|nr:hypothetical protein [Acidobacteriota bacterium]